MQSGPPPAPGEKRSIALALVNTRRRERRGLIDEIASAESLGVWLESRGLGANSPRPSRAALERVHALRDAIRSLMHAATAGQQPSESALRTLNAAARAAPQVPSLAWTAERGPVRRYMTLTGDANQHALSQIATDAIELFTDERGNALVDCSGPGCIRFLLKDHHRRQWCSAACGERARAARYYQRTRERSGT